MRDCCRFVLMKYGGRQDTLQYQANSCLQILTVLLAYSSRPVVSLDVHVDFDFDGSQSITSY